jgi:uridine monophosphate synthetase
MDKDYIQRLLADCVQYGSFTLSSGISTDHYIDVHSLISRPASFKDVIGSLPDLSFHYPSLRVCGVPHGATALATGYSWLYDVSQVLLRKEVKAHGLQKLLEGCWSPGDEVLLLDDVWTTGSSMRQAQEVLESLGLRVVAKWVIVWRGQGDPLPDMNYLITEAELLKSTVTEVKTSSHV